MSSSPCWFSRAREIGNQMPRVTDIPIAIEKSRSIMLDLIIILLRETYSVDNTVSSIDDEQTYIDCLAKLVPKKIHFRQLFPEDGE